MANRHGHKQLQRAARARMAETGESYQRARAAVLMLDKRARPPRARSEATAIGVDLLPIRYFGLQAALATFEIAGRLSVLVLSGAQGRGAFPLNPLIALGPPRAIH